MPEELSVTAELLLGPTLSHFVSCGRTLASAPEPPLDGFAPRSKVRLMQQVTSGHVRAGARASWAFREMTEMISFKGLGDRIRSEEQARKLPLARIIAAGPPADSGITLAAWPSWYECEFFACPRRGTTCADPKCKIGSACLAMREIGLDGNGGPLRRRERPKCGARNRQGEPCAVRVEPGKARCRFHGGLSTGPRTIEGRARVAEAQRQRWARYHATTSRRVN